MDMVPDNSMEAECLNDTSSVKLQSTKEWKFEEWLQFCAIGKLLDDPEIHKFATLYYPKVLPQLKLFLGEIAAPVDIIKDLHINRLHSVEVLEALNNFLATAPDVYEPIIDWTEFLEYLNGLTDNYEIWLATNCLCSAMKMSAAQRSSMQQMYLVQDVVASSVVRFEAYKYKFKNYKDRKKLKQFLESSGVLNVLKDDVSVISQSFFKLHNSRATDLEVSPSGLVLVPSTRENLKQLALGIVSGKAVFLKGAVGSGKTMLVEELADETGMKASRLQKVQLCDHLDSKTLLGMYCCTDVPGEFIWRPGVLTQAVTEGLWILLEDIDSASTDVVATLSSLVESGQLYISGHGVVKADPCFRLFVTQRSTEHENMSNLHFLEKKWVQVSVASLNEEELLSIIKTKFPFLECVAQDILKVFLPLSNKKQDDNEVFISKNIHKFKDLSTRDLIKWCVRVGRRWNMLDLEQKIKHLYIHAIHLFCSNINNKDERFKMAVFVAYQLNLNKDIAKFFLEDYKPHVSVTENALNIGSVSMEKQEVVLQISRLQDNTFFLTRQALFLMEGVAYCIENKEPVLLVGETGTGKTSIVQYLARSTGHKLTVINMNQQSDSSDLLGGYKPVDPVVTMESLYSNFVDTFKTHLCPEKNQAFLSKLEEMQQKGHWNRLIPHLKRSSEIIIEQLQRKKKEQLDTHSDATNNLIAWFKLQKQIVETEERLRKQQVHALKFIEGSLVQAVIKGEWVLLDEINLANAETLQCLSGLLESDQGSVHMFEKGEKQAAERHKGFRLFACMNPATDVGKKELPVGLRNRFTEFFVDELNDKIDLIGLIGLYLRGVSLQTSVLEKIYRFYITVQSKVPELLDGAGNTPHYSLRTLCRALKVAARNPCGTVLRSLYESFYLSFITHLNDESQKRVLSIFESIIFQQTKLRSIVKSPIPEPQSSSGRCTCVEGFWIRRGSSDNGDSQRRKYILTSTVKKNMRDLARIVSLSDFPVLIQGETSVGKTSLICELAALTNNHCVRINNHEHTDVQEYVGTYLTNSRGHLVFVEGILVQAMRKGYWLILDELNLAPTDVLESLNRLLDDNRELFITETQTTVKAHPDFRLFATQNPPGLYGGRKVLSRAFRNRFVELHFSPLPSQELKDILHQRCEIPPSYSQKMVATMLRLQALRRGSAAFAGKEGFVTLRDLFRWAERYRLTPSSDFPEFHDWVRHVAEEGYLLLTAKVRKPEEVTQIKSVLDSVFGHNIDPSNLFTLNEKTSLVTKTLLKTILESSLPEFRHIVWTYNMRRLAVLVGKAFLFNEPVLVVGETGCGKTTVCQYLAALARKKLFTVNCHMHSESADFLGGLRPVRNPSDNEKNALFEWVDGPLVNALMSGDIFLVDEISLADDSVLERLNPLLEPERMILIPERPAFKSADMDYVVTAQDGFKFIATMNPGGDYGKKELSPALRNRFTEIWCEPCENHEDLLQVISTNLRLDVGLNIEKDVLVNIGLNMLRFIDWLKSSAGYRFTYSIRDILTWVIFMKTMVRKSKPDTFDNDLVVAYVHGAYLTFIDGLGMGSSETNLKASDLYSNAQTFLKKQVGYTITELHSDTVIHTNGFFGVSPFVIPSKRFTERREEDSIMEVDSCAEREVCSERNALNFSRGSLSCPKSDNAVSSNEGSAASTEDVFSFQPRTTCNNLIAVLRGMQLKKPILLEGRPGVGKTRLIQYLASITGHRLVRINVSEQTDISDLFGSDLPVENGEAGQFAWRDGPFLRALKTGDWILLDELNLSSQSVLEGLNACLDHRGEIFIPELGQTFTVNADTTYIFGTQNPPAEGGARKCLPKSFLNRFTKIYVNPLSTDDYNTILKHKFPELPLDLIEKMTLFNASLVIKMKHMDCSNVSWELNLRDLSRWCSILVQHREESSEGVFTYNPGRSVQLIYVDRMRTKQDKDAVISIYNDIFGMEYPYYGPENSVELSNSAVKLGSVVFSLETDLVTKRTSSDLLLLRQQLPTLCSLSLCVYKNWHPLLVGGPNTGKSSIVQLLATLTNHELHVFPMNSSVDSLEILGSFEQSDGGSMLLTEVCKKLENIIFTNIRTILSKILRPGNYEDAQIEKSMNNWKDFLILLFNYRKMCQQINVTDVDDFEKRSATCNDIISLIDKLSSSLERYCYQLNSMSEFCKVTEMLPELKANVKSVMRLKTRGPAGQFVWIDSVLVKCMVEGKWLLMENVNLCSAAVLDRLNCLLEPGGSLIIGEKGVNAENELEEIKPHPDFRIFFTMNPQYGEISRAMKNRCVEICLLDNMNDCPLSSVDIRSLLHHIGIRSLEKQDALLELHKSFEQDTSAFFTIGNLLQAADLISQQMACGVNFTTSALSVCKDVYPEFIKNELDNNVIKKSEMLRDKKPGKFEYIDLASVTLKSSSLTENLEFKVIQQEMSLIRSVLEQACNRGESCFGSTYFSKLFDVSEYDVPVQMNDLYRHLVLCFYRNSTSLDLTLRNSCMEFEVGKFKKRRHLKIPISTLTNISELSSTYSSALAGIISHVVVSCGSDMYLTSFADIVKNSCSEYKKTLRLYYESAEFFVENEHLKTRQTLPVPVYTVKEISEKKLSNISTSEPILFYYSAFRKCFDDYVRMRIDKLSCVDTKKYVCLLLLTHLRNNFINVGYSTLAEKRRNEWEWNYDTFYEVIILYKWIIEFCSRDMEEGKAGNEETEVVELMSFHKQILNSLKSSNLFSLESTRILRSRFGQPRIIKNLDLLNLSVKFIGLSSVQCIWDKFSDYLDKLVLLFLSTNFLTLRNDLVTYLLDEELDIVRGTDKFNLLNAPTESYMRSDTSELKNNVDLNKVFQVHLWPVCELMALWVATFVRRKSLEDNVFDVAVVTSQSEKELFSLSSVLNILVRMTSCLPTIPIDMQFALERMQTVCNDPLACSNTFPEFFRLLLSHCVHSPVVNEQVFYLFWNHESIFDVEKLTEGIFYPHDSSSLSSPLLSLMVSFVVHPVWGAQSPVPVPTVETHVARNQQLSSLLSLLWRNMGFVTHSEMDYVLNELRCAVSGFSRFYNILQSTEFRENIYLNVSVKCPSFTLKSPTHPAVVPHIDLLKKLNIYGNEAVNIFELLLIDVYEASEKLNNERESDGIVLFQAGKIWYLLGLLQLLIFGDIGMCDEQMEHRLKVKYLEQEVNEMHARSLAEDMMANIRSYYAAPPSFEAQYSTKEILRKALLKDMEQLEKLRENVPPHRNTLAFRKLSEMCSYHVKTIRKSGLELFLNIDKILKKVEMSNFEADCVDYKSHLNNLCQQLKNSVNRINEFVKEMNVPSYFTFRDLTEPLKCSSVQIVHGMILIKNYVTKIGSYDNNQASLILENLLQFPFIGQGKTSSSFLAKQCQSINSCKIISPAMSKDSDEASNCRTVNGNLRLALMSAREICNEVLTRKSARSELLSVFEELLYSIVSYVDGEENQQSEDQQSLDEKSLLNIINLMDDEEPTEDVPSEYLEDDKENEMEQDTPEGNGETSKSSDTKPKDAEVKGILEEMCDIHRTLLTVCARATWLEPEQSNAKIDYITPFLERFRTCRQIFVTAYDKLDRALDKKLLPSMALLSALTLSAGDGDSQEFNLTTRQSHYNFYKDPKENVAMSCLKPLNDVVIHTRELLEQWPDNPVLLQIVALVSRILKFSVTSPAARFLTGFEMLFEKILEWESNAYVKVSLASDLEAIDNFVMDLKKMELEYWKESLAGVESRFKDGVGKWWKIMFSLIQFYLNNDTSSADELILLLKRFVEESPLGEYEMRLNLLLQFHRHYLCTPPSQKRDEVVKLLWNVYFYYGQFLEPVRLKIKDLRRPIEKKLKDYLKIVRSSSKIFFRGSPVSVRKTRRSLQKFAKDYEGLLKECVSFAMTYKDDKVFELLAKYPSTSIEEFDFVKTFNLEVGSLCTEGTEISQFLSKSESYLSKAVKFCEKCVKKNMYSQHITDMDDIVVSVVDRLATINTAEANEKTNKKYVVRLRRTFFDDLFHQLQEAGFSYRTGLTKSGDNVDGTLFYLPPFDVKIHFLKSGVNSLIAAWSGVTCYFPQCLSRYMLLQKTLQKPSKDVNMSHIDRISGYSSHLLVLTRELYENIAQTFSNLSLLNSVISRIKSWMADKSNFRYDTAFSIWSESVKDAVVAGVMYLEQLSVLLTASPSGTYHASNLLNENLVNFSGNTCNSPAFQAIKGDDVWNCVMQQVETMKRSLTSVVSDLSVSENIFLDHHRSVSESTSDRHKKMVNACAAISDVSRQTKTLRETYFVCIVENSEEQYQPLCDGLFWLEQMLSSKAEEFQSVLDQWGKSLESNLISEDSDCHDEFNKCADKLLNKILYSIQEQFKIHGSDKNETDASDIKLSQKLYSDLMSDIRQLDIQSVCDTLQFLIDQVIKYGSNTDVSPSASVYIRTLVACCPFLECFSSFCQYYLTLEATVLKSSCRLLYTVLGVFIDVASKGFHIPPDETPESVGDDSGCTSGQGFGDGEGEKDISDQIETEDQLEEAKQRGDEEEPADKSCKEEKEGIEASENFEGKGQDFDKEEGEQEDNDESEDEEIDQEMGELESNEGQLDDKLWNDEGNDNEEEGSEEESGKDKSGDNKSENAEMGAKEMDVNEQTENSGQDGDENKKEKSRNDIEEEEEQEDQVDPYHGQQQPDVEPEPLDLPDKMELDDGDEGEGQGDNEEENPFDIDAMKDPASPKPEDKNSAEDKENKEGSGNEDSSDSEDENEDNLGDKNEDGVEESADADKEDESEGMNEDIKNDDNVEESAQDDTEQKEQGEKTELPSQDPAESSEPMEKLDGSNDRVNTGANEEESAVNEEQLTEDVNDESDKNDEGIGQSQFDKSEEGHHQQAKQKHKKGATDNTSEPNVENMKKPPSSSDNKRTLGDTSLPVKKRLRVSHYRDDEINDDENESAQENEPEEKNASDMYEHVKEGTESFDRQTYDTATKEQIKQQESSQEEENKMEESVDELQDVEMKEQDEESDDVLKETPEKLNTKSSNKEKNSSRESEKLDKNTELTLENKQNEDEEGETIKTYTAARGSESFFETMTFDNAENGNGFSEEFLAQVRLDQEKKLTTWKPASPDAEAEALWRNYLCLTAPLAQELCEKLRTVLEPTKASHLQGDYRTGRRINMRKVIPYIASQFRKDKIWLRRTKLAKREYQIVLAVDDSASMEDNHSKGMAFESVALVSQALNLLEAGSLGVVSFGSTVNILHPLGNVFTSTSGARILQGLSFQQNSTQVGRLVEFVNSLFTSCKEQQSFATCAQLLLVVSDGRSLIGEGLNSVKRAVHRAMEANIFIVFIIIDNPNNEESILDVQIPVFEEAKLILMSYIENFPFPFYVILKDINSLPRVLGDALRQWFELVVNSR